MLLAQRCWAWAPVRRMPLQHRHHWRRALPMTRRDLGRADLARARRAVPRTMVARADLADMARAVLVARADPGTSTRTDPVVQADLVAHGTGMTGVAISTGPRGVTDPHPGDRVSRRGRTGTDRFHRPAGSGGMAQSTTGATRKRPFGTPGSTRGASGSSEFGSRCKKPDHATPAWPIGRAGVAVFMPAILR